MDMQYYFDGSLPQHMVSDFIVLFEELFRRCPSDAALSITLLTLGGKLCADVSLSSAALHFKETLEHKTPGMLKQGIKNLFKARVSGWRHTRGDEAEGDQQ